MPGIAEQFVGSWRLVSVTARRPDDPSELYGPAPTGRILYAANGAKAVVVGRPDLPAVAAADASPEQARELLEGFAAYTGRWEIDEHQGTVVHRIDYSLDPAFTGTSRVRRYRFEGDRIVLTTANNELVFEREEAEA
jgi:hypothetical protein